MDKNQSKEIPISYAALDALKDMVWLSGLYVTGDKVNDLERTTYYEALAVLRLELGAALEQDV